MPYPDDFRGALPGEEPENEDQRAEQLLVETQEALEAYIAQRLRDALVHISEAARGPFRDAVDTPMFELLRGEGADAERVRDGTIDEALPYLLDVMNDLISWARSEKYPGYQDIPAARPITTAVRTPNAALYDGEDA